MYWTNFLPHFLSFLGPFLLFVLELMTAQKLLPFYGGSAQVWNVCSLFFLGILCLAYHMVQILVQKNLHFKFLRFHGTLLFISSLPLLLPKTIFSLFSYPEINIFLFLLKTIGPSFFLLAMTSPLIQFIQSYQHSQLSLSSSLKNREVNCPNKYWNTFFFSNLGSFAALLIYPFFIDNFFMPKQKEIFWLFLFIFYILGMVLFIFNFNNILKISNIKLKELELGNENDQNIHMKIPFIIKWRWILLSASACAFMLSTTNFFAFEIPSVPLLWIMPLAIYLLTLILNFREKSVKISSNNSNIFLFFLPLILIPIHSKFQVIFYSSIVLIYPHLLILFIVLMVTHRHLYSIKPMNQAHLTQYHSFISIGGILGSFWISIGIPILGRNNFNSFLDYITSFALFLLALLLPRIQETFKLLTMFRILVLSIFISLLFLATAYWKNQIPTNTKQSPLYAIRNFYGIYQIKEVNQFRLLFHGPTLHGAESTNKLKKNIPLSYYHSQSPIGRLWNSMRIMNFPLKDVALIGLGAGTLLAYGVQKEHWDLFELDSDVVEMAKKYFTFLSSAQPKWNIHLGDARISLQKVADHSYDVIILDAFSGGTPPTHLLTLESLLLYQKKLRSHGILIFHISHNYLNLKAVLNATAKKLNWTSAYDKHKATIVEEDQYIYSSEWLVLSHQSLPPPLFLYLTQKQHWVDGKNPQLFPNIHPWSDDSIYILEALKKN